MSEDSKLPPAKKGTQSSFNHLPDDNIYCTPISTSASMLTNLVGIDELTD